MWEVKRSNLFMQQWRFFAIDYKARAGISIAERFIGEVEDAIDFISKYPLSCSAYDSGYEFDSLSNYEFRKWS